MLMAYHNTIFLKKEQRHPQKLTSFGAWGETSQVQYGRIYSRHTTLFSVESYFLPTKVAARVYCGAKCKAAKGQLKDSQRTVKGQLKDS